MTASRATRTRRVPAILAASASLTLVLAACSGTSSIPTAAQAPAPTTAPAAPANPTTAPAAPTLAPTQPTNNPAAAPAQPTTAPAPAQAAATPATAARPSTRLTLAQGQNEARFRAREILAGATITNEAVGKTSDVSGTIVLEPSGAINAERSKFTVGLASLKSDQAPRDQLVQRFELQTDKFPTAEFVPHRTEGLRFPLPASGDATFKLSGDLTVHGVTKPVTWDVTAQFAPDAVTGSAVVPTTLADWDMPVPKVPRVASIEDVLKLELDFRAARASE